MEELIIVRTGKRYEMLEVPGESMTRRQLVVLLGKCFRIAPSEMAEMFLEFHLDKAASRAHFGINLTFLYCD